MDYKEYDNLVKSHTPKENVMRNVFLAFLMGGLLGIAAEGMYHLFLYLGVGKTDARTYIILVYIAIGCIATGLGFFDKWVGKFRAGLLIPITGFAHSMTSSAMEHKREGLVTGIGANIFKLAGTVLLYGMVGAFFVALIQLVLLGG